ncbi:MAG TPA: hypothetical protein VHA77_18675 [Xanthobacteraceae bacterium]|jgi:hypothetical protein|nr:hypothetical protein [Xanthobacteraceae bacterium]
MPWQTSESHATQVAGAGANASATIPTSDTSSESAISPIILAGCLALAVGAGAFLSLSGTSGFDAALKYANLDTLLDTVGLSRSSIATTEQKQADTISRLDRGMDALSAQVAVLTSKMEAAGLGDADQRLSRLDTDVGHLKDQIAAIQTAQDDPFTLEGSKVDATMLRSSIDELSARSNSQIAAVNKRLDRIEMIVAGRAEVTGSISAPPSQRKRTHRAGISGWTAQEIFGTGIVVVGSSGTYEAKPGTTVPGLGRIEAIRLEDGHSTVVTNRGSLIVQ